MSKDVSAAIGTQRQFAKQPEGIYQASLDSPNFQSGLNPKTHVNYDAQLLAKSLGIIPKAIMNEMQAQDKRETDQLTLINADKIFAGKTEEDLKKFDMERELTNVSDQFDFSDNKKAVALLEKGMGRIASTFAKQKWANDPASQKPQSVEESVALYNKYLQETADSFKENITNPTAFNQGYYEGMTNDTIKVANEAHTRISDDKRQKTVAMNITQIVDWVYSGNQDLSVVTPMVKQIEMASKTPKEFKANMENVLKQFGEHELDGRRFEAFAKTPVYDGVLSDYVSFAPYRQQIAKNFRRQAINQDYERFKLPNGGFNWDAYNKEKGTRPTGMFGKSIPNVPIPVSEGDNPDLENLSPQFKEAMPYIGGVLFNMGYGDVMQITSGYRDATRNAEAGGVENSQHLTGNALDVYIGNPSSEEMSSLKQKLSPYFDFIDVHDSGSGVHLHLQGYQGGLDKVEDKEDYSYSAYDPFRSDEIDKGIIAKVNTEKSRYNVQKTEIKNKAISDMAQADSLEASYSIIDKAQGLSDGDKMVLKTTMSNVWSAREAAKTGKLKGDALKIVNYEHPMSATNVYTDMAKLEDYNLRLKQHNDPNTGGVDYKGKTEFTPEEQEKYDTAARHLNWYYSQIYPDYGKPKAPQETKKSSEQPKAPQESIQTKEQQPAPQQPSKTEDKTAVELSGGFKELKAKNYSDAQIYAYIEKFAKEKNIDVNYLINIFKEGQNEY